MRIDNSTKTGDILRILDRDMFEELMDKVPEVELEKPLLEMTVGEFLTITQDPDSKVTEMLETESNALRAFGMVKRLKSELDGIFKFLKMNEIEENADVKAAKATVVFPTFEEQMLLDCVEAFHLHSMDEAEEVKLTDILVWKKAKSASEKFECKYNKIIEAKNKMKTR